MSNKQRAMIDALRDAGCDAFTNRDGYSVTVIVLDQDPRGVIFDREQRLHSFADLRSFLAS